MEIEVGLRCDNCPRPAVAGFVLDSDNTKRQRYCKLCLRAGLASMESAIANTKPGEEHGLDNALRLVREAINRAEMEPS